jgi:hypothetical protein
VIFPLSWFPWIVFFTWPFLVLMTTSVIAALGAESAWLGLLVAWHERKRRRRGVRPRP